MNARTFEEERFAVLKSAGWGDFPLLPTALSEHEINNMYNYILL